MNHLKCALVALALLGPASCGRPAGPPPVVRLPAADSLWGDGRTEVSTYTGTVEQGAEALPATARLAVRLRPVAGGDTIGALVSDIEVAVPTEAGFESTAVVLDPRTLDLRELSVTRREACGPTRVTVAPGPRGLAQTVASCLAGIAPGETPVAWPAEERPRVCRDALPVWLRGLAARAAGGRLPLEVRVWLLPGQLSARDPRACARPLDALVRVSAADTLQVPAGRFAALEIAVGAEGKADAFWVARDAPHALLKVQTAAHRTFELTGVERLAPAPGAAP